MVQNIQREGIGLTIGTPTFVSGTLHLPIQQAVKLLTSDKQYFRIGPNWLPRQSLTDAGVATLQKETFSPIVLTPAEIFTYGATITKGIWTNVEFPLLKLPESNEPLRTAELHLQFLRKWGIPGGIIGSIKTYRIAFERLFEVILDEQPSAKILIVGDESTLDEACPPWQHLITGRLNGEENDPSLAPFSQGVFSATPKALKVRSALLNIKWNLICLLNADMHIKTERSPLFQSLTHYRKLFIVGLFASDEFLMHKQAPRVIAELFDLSQSMDTMPIWKYVLRKPEQNPPALPAPYQKQPGPKASIPSSIQPAEFIIAPLAPSNPLPIPPRPRTIQPIQLEEVSTSEAAAYSNPQESTFIRQARRLADRTEEVASFVTFHRYWPTYNDMDSLQEKWYFYWRTQVRREIYPDTSLSYIFVHIYELINYVGIQNQLDGYKSIHRLWSHYRQPYPILDSYLPDWMVDYVIINGCPVDPLAIYGEVAAKGDFTYTNYDLILAYYIDKPLTEMPLSLLEKLSDHDIRRSKFYNAGYQHLVEQYIPAALEQVNQKLGKGIFERYKPSHSTLLHRRPFERAIYEGHRQRVSLGHIFPYAHYQPLRSYLTALVKYTENKLREREGFKSRLRGPFLDRDSADVIDNLIAGIVISAVSQSPRPRITIDLDEVERLKEESSQIFKMLQPPPETTSESLDGSSQEPTEKPNHLNNRNINDSPPTTRAQSPKPRVAIDLDEVERLREESSQIFNMLQPPPETTSESLDGPSQAPTEKPNHLNNRNINDSPPTTRAQSPKPRVAIDLDEVERLREESSQTFNRLQPPPETTNESDGPSQEPTEKPNHLNNRNINDSPLSLLNVAPQFNHELPAEWSVLASYLTMPHLQVLKALLTEDDPSDTISQIARVHITMPGPLLDQINEWSQDIIGDIIIETMPIPHISEPEYRVFTQKIVTIRQ